MYSNPTYDPQPAREPQHPGGPGLLRRSSTPDPDKPDAAARVPRDLPAGLDVQGRHDRGRARHRHGHARHRTFPTLTELDLPQHRTTRCRTSAASRCGGTLVEQLQSSRATRRSASSASTSATRSRPGWRSSASARPPPLDVAPGAVGEHRPAAGLVRDRTSRCSRSPASARATSPSPRCEMALVAGGGRQRRRDHAAARRPGRSPTTTASAVADDRRRSRGRRRCRPQTAATMHDADDRRSSSSGTGTAAQIPGVAVAGKTGTAQTVDGAAPHAWFIAFAPADDAAVRGGGDRRERRRAPAARRPAAQVAAPIARTGAANVCSDHPG